MLDIKLKQVDKYTNEKKLINFSNNLFTVV